MIIIKTPQQIEGIRKAGAIVAETIFEMAKYAQPGTKTKTLEDVALSVFEKYGAKSAFLGYKPDHYSPPYPANICVSVNDEIVHGIPGDRVIMPGDLVSVDVGVIYENYYGDAAATYVIEGASKRAKKLAWVTYQALHRGIKAARAGGRVSDISRAIQSFVESNGFSVVRDLVGHGVGLNLHEEPPVPNFVDKDSDAPLRAGMTIAIEPMICEGDWQVRISSKDGWTVTTADGKLAAHFEHSIAILENRTIILTLLPDGSEPYIPPKP